MASSEAHLSFKRHTRTQLTEDADRELEQETRDLERQRNRVKERGFSWG